MTKELHANPEFPTQFPYRRVLDHGFVALVDVMGADASSWTAFFAPAGIPAAARDRLSREIIAALKKPETLAALDKIGFTVQIIEPDAFRAYQVKEIEAWTEIAKAAGIKPGE